MELAVKRLDDECRAAFVRSDGFRGADARMLVPVPFGNLVRVASHYPRASHVFGGKHARFQVGDAVIEDSHEAAAKKMLPSLAAHGIKGIAVAGGAPLSCITKGDASKFSDYDLFIYGENDEYDSDEQFVSKARKIITYIDEKREERAEYVSYVMSRTENGITVTFHRSQDIRDATVDPPLIVQVILRKYRSVAHVLLGFDLDASAFAYIYDPDTGYRFVGLQRAIRALQWQANLVDVDRQSETFERRLYNYAVNKGMDVIVPGASPLDYTVGYMLETQNADDKHGLIALLRLALGGKAPPKDATYAGMVNGVDLLGDSDTFKYRAYYTAKRNVRFPMVMVTEVDLYSLPVWNGRVRRS